MEEEGAGNEHGLTSRLRLSYCLPPSSQFSTGVIRMARLSGMIRQYQAPAPRARQPLNIRPR
eukprot:767673-Hanusia_phi.AAC.1